MGAFSLSGFDSLDSESREIPHPPGGKLVAYVPAADEYVISQEPLVVMQMSERDVMEEINVRRKHNAELNQEQARLRSTLLSGLLMPSVMNRLAEISASMETNDRRIHALGERLMLRSR